MNELEQPIRYLILTESVQIPLEEGLIALGVIGFLILLVITHIGSSRFKSLKDTYVDTLAEKVKQALNQSNQIQASSWEDFQKNKQNGLDELARTKKEVHTHLKNTDKIKPLAWNEFKAFTHKSRLSEVALFDARIESLNHHIKELTAEIDQLEHCDQTVKHNHYIATNQTYRDLCNLTEQWTQAVILYQNVLSEIDEAQSAISSAQTAEVVDLFSKNKAVSVWSSMSTSSAQSEIRDIKPSIERLVDHLRKLQKQESIAVQTIEVSDTVDLVSDLFFDFSFDFTSIFSLMNLNSAASSVDNIESQIESLGSPLRSALSKHQQVQADFLNKLA